MVARIESGKSIRGVLSYNENKLKNAEATLLMAAGFPRPPERLSFKNKLERFQYLTRQNNRTRTNTLHITLNFSRDDRLEEEQLQLIANDYMERIGFGSQPYLVYQHFDAAHPHIHIATVNIADGGERIETHNIGRYQSEKARKVIEEAYGLVKAEDQKKEYAYQLKPIDLQKALYGKSETKAAISSIVREVTKSYKYASLPELNAVLRQFNVIADRGDVGTRMYEKKGLMYCLLNEQGSKVGIPIKSSSIYGKPTLPNLERQFLPNKTARKPYGERLKHLLDKALDSSHNLDELKAALQPKGIRIILRENVLGNIYGATFIDNATRVVFNGSSLGKSYSAKALLERLPTGIIASLQNKQAPSTATTEPLNEGEMLRDVIPCSHTHPAHEQPFIEIIWDTALSYNYEEDRPDPFKRKKKRKRLQSE